MIAKVLATLSPWGPVFFGLGLLAPLIAQTLERFSVTPPLGMTPLATGLIIGPAVGLCAKLRGRWL